MGPLLGPVVGGGNKNSQMGVSLWEQYHLPIPGGPTAAAAGLGETIWWVLCSPGPESILMWVAHISSDYSCLYSMSYMGP